MVALSEIWRKFMRRRHQNDDDACESGGGDNIVDVYCNQEFMFSTRSLSWRRKVVLGPWSLALGTLSHPGPELSGSG